MDKSMGWRLWRNATTSLWSARRAFPAAVRERIAGAIGASERKHGGELRFVVEAALTPGEVAGGVSPRQRAWQVFGELGAWDTEENCGVLIYVLLAERRIEIVADRGIQRAVGGEPWQRICEAMQERFRSREFEAGALEAIEAVTGLLAAHFPRRPDDRNELPNELVIIR